MRAQRQDAAAGAQLVAQHAAVLGEANVGSLTECVREQRYQPPREAAMDCPNYGDVRAYSINDFTEADWKVADVREEPYTDALGMSFMRYACGCKRCVDRF